jgi:hypothetical protein
MMARMHKLLDVECSVNENNPRRTITNLRMATDHEYSAVTIRLALEMLLDVTMHMLIMCTLPSALILAICGYAQSVYAQTTGAGSDPLGAFEMFMSEAGVFGNGASQLLGEDDATDERAIYAGVQIGLTFCLVLFIVWTSRLIYAYSNPDPTMMHSLIRKAFAVVLALLIFTLTFWIGMVRCAFFRHGFCCARVSIIELRVRCTVWRVFHRNLHSGAIEFHAFAPLEATTCVRPMTFLSDVHHSSYRYTL